MNLVSASFESDETIPKQLFDPLSEREVLDETDLLGRYGRST